MGGSPSGLHVQGVLYSVYKQCWQIFWRSVLAAVDQPAFGDPRHHGVQALADDLDRMP